MVQIMPVPVHYRYIRCKYIKLILISRQICMFYCILLYMFLFSFKLGPNLIIGFDYH